MRKPLLIAAIPILGMGASIPALWPGPRAHLVVVAPVVQLPELRSVVNGSGQLKARQSVDIQAEIAGIVVELPVKEGDRVRKGQVLLKIDPFQTETDVGGARAQVGALQSEAAAQEFQIASAAAAGGRDESLKKSAQVELRRAEANRARARTAHDRDQKLLQEKLLSRDQFEISQTQLTVEEAQVEAAEAKVQEADAQVQASRANLDFARAGRQAALEKVEAARHSLRRSEDLLQRTVIRSPFDGVVVKRNIELGERAVPGILSNPQATLMTIGDVTSMEAELKVDETDIVSVALGQTGRVVVDALSDLALQGEVIEIGSSPLLSPGAESSGGSRTASSSGQGQEGKDFKVVLRLAGGPPSLRPGMSCQAGITTAVHQDVLAVPVQALTMREVRLDRDGRMLPSLPRDEELGRRLASASSPEQIRELQGVFICDPDERARFRPVKTGITGDTEVEVLAGLESGEKVVVGPLQALRILEEASRIKVDRDHLFRPPPSERRTPEGPGEER